MAISRRALLRNLGAGAAAGVGYPALVRASGADAGSPSASAIESSAPVRLHRNENPFGASPSAMAAIREAGAAAATRYPDSANALLTRTLSDLHTISPDQIVLGCGSDDVLGRVFSAVGPGCRVIVAVPTYERIAQHARRVAAALVGVPLRNDHAHDLEAMRACIGAEPTIVYICNPHNPTGSLTVRRDLDAFIAALPPAAFVVIDEAYHHYVGVSAEYVSFIDRPAPNPRVIVTRSFSAIHGLAGMRVGYAVTSRETAALLASPNAADIVPAVSALAAVAASRDPEHVRTARSRNHDSRQEFCNQANARMLRTIDSHTNFVLLNTGHPGPEMVEHFRKNGVLVAGPFARYDRHIRVSLGTPAEMQAFWRVSDLLPPTHVMTM